jgi:hypothetical protein
MATLDSLERRILEAVRAITDEGDQATTATVDARLSDAEVPPDQPLERLKDRGLLDAQEPEPMTGWVYTLSATGRAARAQDSTIPGESICDAPRRVVRPLRQKIVGRNKHGRQQQVEVGEHRGPKGRRRDINTGTSDFDLLPYESFEPTTATAAVESLI